MNTTTIIPSRNIRRTRNSRIAERHNTVIGFLLNAMTSAGYELSEQRLRVIHALYALESINNAEELWILLNGKKKISRAVIYCCLDIFHKLGYVSKSNKSPGGASYQLQIEINKSKRN